MGRTSYITFCMKRWFAETSRHHAVPIFYFKTNIQTSQGLSLHTNLESTERCSVSTLPQSSKQKYNWPCLKSLVLGTFIIFVILVPYASFYSKSSPTPAPTSTFSFGNYSSQKLWFWGPAKISTWTPEQDRFVIQAKTIIKSLASPSGLSLHKDVSTLYTILPITISLPISYSWLSWGHIKISKYLLNEKMGKGMDRCLVVIIQLLHLCPLLD